MLTLPEYITFLQATDTMSLMTLISNNMDFPVLDAKLTNL